MLFYHKIPYLKNIFVKYMSKVKDVQTKSVDKINYVVQMNSDVPLKSYYL